MKSDHALILVAKAAQCLLALTAAWAGWSALAGHRWGLALLCACILGLLAERWPATRDRSPHARSQPYRQRRADFTSPVDFRR